MDLQVTQMSRSSLIRIFQVDSFQLTKEAYVFFLIIIESKKLAKYNAALKKSSQVDFD